jgi:hypothetical protein
LFGEETTVLVFSAVSGDQFLVWGWRIPFLLSNHDSDRHHCAPACGGGSPLATPPGGDRSTVGTTIEWYDFLLYSVVTGLVFGKLFFPKSDPLVGVLEAFAVYTVGFIARPIGAAILGHFGDRIGRKAALIATLLITGLSTFAVGFCPRLRDDRDLGRRNSDRHPLHSGRRDRW